VPYELQWHAGPAAHSQVVQGPAEQNNAPGLLQVPLPSQLLQCPVLSVQGVSKPGYPSLHVFVPLHERCTPHVDESLEQSIGVPAQVPPPLQWSS